MIDGLKSLTNLSIPQRAIRALIIKLFQAKIKLRQGSRMTESAPAGAQRAAKTQAIENIFKEAKKVLEKIQNNSQIN